MKKLFYILFLLALIHEADAQQLPLYSQYAYNKFLINPAHAGSDGFTSFNITAREQWIGYSGAPRTYSFSWQTRFRKRGYRLRGNIFNDNLIYVPKTEGKVGLGAYVFSDHNGLVQRTGFQTTYSYHVWVRDYTQLSFGLGISGYHYIINADEYSFEDPDEAWLNDNLRRGIFVPDVDFGIYLQDPYFNIGLSAQQMLASVARLGEYAYKEFRMDRHFYLFGSYTFTPRIKNDLEPSVLLKMSEQVRPQADIGLTYVYDQAFWLGLTYRTGGAIVANTRFRFFPTRVGYTSVYVGYAFDFTLNKIQRVTYGTHEVTIAIKLGDSAKRFRWLDRL